MGAMLVIGMGPRKAGEAETSPAPSTKSKESNVVKLPASLLSIEGEDGVSAPEAGDEVELTGTVEKVDGDIVHIRISDAVADAETETEETAPEMSEEDSLLEMAKKADEERA